MVGVVVEIPGLGVERMRAGWVGPTNVRFAGEGIDGGLGPHYI